VCDVPYPIETPQSYWEGAEEYRKAVELLLVRPTETPIEPPGLLAAHRAELLLKALLLAWGEPHQVHQCAFHCGRRNFGAPPGIAEIARSAAPGCTTPPYMLMAIAAIPTIAANTPISLATHAGRSCIFGGRLH
jgi:hypothetical protein